MHRIWKTLECESPTNLRTTNKALNKIYQSNIESPVFLLEDTNYSLPSSFTNKFSHTVLIISTKLSTHIFIAIFGSLGNLKLYFPIAYPINHGNWGKSKTRAYLLLPINSCYNVSSKGNCHSQYISCAPRGATCWQQMHGSVVESLYQDTISGDHDTGIPLLWASVGSFLKSPDKTSRDWTSWRLKVPLHGSWAKKVTQSSTLDRPGI